MNTVYAPMRKHRGPHEVWHIVVSGTTACGLRVRKNNWRQLKKPEKNICEACKLADNSWKAK